MVAWPIKTALNSRYVDRVIVTTDDPAIAKVALEYGAEVPFMRPAEFAKDTSPSSEAVIHAIKFCAEMDGDYDYFVLLEPTSPLTEAADVDKALETLVAGEGLSIVGASKVEASHPVYCATIGDDNFLRPYNRESFAKPIRRQDVDDVYFLRGRFIYQTLKNTLKQRLFTMNARCLISFLLGSLWKLIRY